MKICRECKTEKSIGSFYRHPAMRDGHLNKCIDCIKDRVRCYRLKNIERIRKYDRGRGNRQSVGYLKEYRHKYPLKYKAVLMVNNAIRDNKLFKEPCEVCGSKKRIHAHHDDYSKPLNVRWLCASHHRQWHTERSR